VITNTDGTYPLTLSAMTITGDFQIATTGTTCSTTATVAPAKTCTINVTFTPSASGSRTGTLTVSNNGSTTPLTVSLSGLGGANATETTSNPSPGNPNSLNLANTNVGQVSPVQTIKLSDSSTFPVNITGVALSGASPGQFAFVNNCGTQVTNGNPCTINVTFQPTAIGLQTATLTVTSDAATPFTPIALSATGTASQVTLSATSVNFNNQPLHAMASQSITMTDSGTGPLNISGISISGLAASDFSQSSNCGTQVAVGANCTITITFTPSALNSRSAALSIADDAPNSPQTVQLLGNGVQVAAPTVSPSTVTFNNQALNVPSTAQTVTITNNDAANALTLSAPTITGDFQIATAGTTCSASTPVAARGTCTINVTFTPTASGTRTGTLTVANNGSATPLSVALTGTGGAAATENPATPMTLASTNVGQSSPAQAITLTDTSVFPVNITSIAVTGAAASEFTYINGCGTQVTNASPCTISVIFKPTAIGLQTATLTITSDAAAPFAPIALSGTGTAPQVTLSVTNLTFNKQPLNSASASQAIQLTNNGSGPLNISAVTITGLAAGDFSQTNTCGTQVAVNGTCSIAVVFSPTAQYSRSATLSIVDDAPNSPQTVSLLGTGVQVASPTVAPASLTFGSQPLNQASAAQTVKVTNTDGTYPLTLSTPTTTGDFQVSAATTTCASTLAAGSSCLVGVTFTPTASGGRLGTLTIANNSATSPLTVNLSGTGGAVASVNPTSLNLGNSNLNETSAVQNITLTNGSNFPVNITGEVISGASAGQFGIATNNCGTQIPASSNCIIGVVFTPTATGIQTATLTINSDASSAIPTVSLSGTGTLPIVALSPKQLNFASEPVGTSSSPLQVTINNTGTGPLNIALSGIYLSGADPGDFSQTNNCGALVAVGGNCSIFVTFTPAAANARSAVLVIIDDASPSVQQVPLAGTGIPQSGIITLGATTLAFGNVQVGSTSSQQVTVTNTASSGSLTITGINFIAPSSGSFTETNNCNAALTPASSCTVTITFAPTQVDKTAETATLSITGSASDSPQQITMSGMGTSNGTTTGDFTMNPTATGVTVVEGATATYTFYVSPNSGSKDTVKFSCSGPSGTTCSVSPNSLTMDGTTTTTVTMSVNTTGGSGGSARLADPRFSSKPVFFALLPFTLMGILLGKRRRGFWLVMILLAICLLMGLAGCGSGTGSSSSTGPLQPGTYQVVFSGTSSTGTQTSTLSLVVSAK
jgi:hypothetical protein